MSHKLDVLPAVIPFGGVSQQPPHAHSPTQVSGAKNAVAARATGISKRPGTLFERKFTETPLADLRAFSWEVSAGESYRFVFGLANGAAKLRAFREGGGEVSVTITPAAATYLASGSPTAMDIQLVPCKDFLLGINRKVAPSLTNSPDYTLFGTRNTYASLISLTLTTGQTARVLEDSENGRAGHYTYSPGFGYGHINFRTLTDPWSIYNGYWDDAGASPAVGFRIAFRRVSTAAFTGGSWVASTRRLTKTGQWAGYTFKAGDKLPITGGTGFTAGWFQIAAKISNDTIELSSQSGLGGSDTSDVASTDGAGVSPIGLEIEVVVNTSGAKSMDEIASIFETAMRQAGATNACCAWVPQALGGNFQITGPFRGADSYVYPPTAPVGTVGADGNLSAVNRPFDGTTAFQAFAGTGSLGSAADSASPESRWVRSAPPKSALASLDATTMPVQITRQAADTFLVDVADWADRFGGTTTSNPGPDLFSSGTPIACGIWHNSRLFLAGGPYIAASRTNRPLDFWVDDPSQVVDSDPIDKTIPLADSGGVQSLVGFATSLIVFCRKAQFELVSADQPLTPTTAQLIESTRYMVSDVTPRAGTTQVYFAVASGEYSQVAEYFQDQLRVSSEAAIVTAHVPRLLPRNLRAFVALPTQNALLVSEAESANVWCYQYFYQGGDKEQSAWMPWTFGFGTYRICDMAESDGEAWMLVENTGTLAVLTGAARVTIPSHGYVDGNSIYFSRSTTTPTMNGRWYVKVIDANTVEIYDDPGLAGGDLLTITTAGTVRWHTGDYFIERLSLERPQADPGWKWPVHMDRRMTLTGTHSGGTTTFTLPASPSVLTGSAQVNGLGSTLNKIVLGPSFGADSGRVLSITGYTTTSVTVTGNYAAGSVVAGCYYDFSATLTRPFVRDERGRADIRDILSVVGLAVSYQDTSSFRVQVAGGISVLRYRDFIAGETPRASGVLTTNLAGMPERFDWSIVDVSADEAPKPCHITGLFWTVERDLQQ